MNNLKDDIKEFQDLILNDDKINYFNYNNIDYITNAYDNEVNNKEINNEQKKNDENIKKSYMDIYKPIFDLITIRQNMQREKENKNSQRKPYINYVLNYKDKKSEKTNNFNLDNEFNSSNNFFQKTSYTTTANMFYPTYRPKTSSKIKERHKMIQNFKDQYFKKGEDITKLKQNDLAMQLNNMHKTISENIGNNYNIYNIESNNYKNIINNMQKEINMIRKERKKENDIFEKKIKILYDDILNDGKYNNSGYKLKNLYNIYLNSNNKKPKNKNKTKSKNKNKRVMSTKNYNKTKNKYNLGRNNKKIDKILKRSYYNSLNKYKTSPKRKNINKNKSNKIINPTKTYYDKIKNEIKQLNKENEIIENKYKNLPLSIDELNDIINKKCNKNTYNSNSFIHTDYKKNVNTIKKNMDEITKNIIDDLLYECIPELMYIEDQRSEKNQKKRLMNKLNITRVNLGQYNENEKELVSNYNIKNIKEKIIIKNENGKYNKTNYFPIKRKLIANIDNDMYEKCDYYQAKFLEYMILNGSFYSDFVIFDVYDIFIEEMSKKIMEEEIDSFLKKADVLVEKICDNEIKDINQ